MLEEAKSEVLCALRAFEKLGATKNVEYTGADPDEELFVF